MCDNITLMNEGKIVEFEKTKEICRKYNAQRKVSIHLADGSNVELNHDGELAEKGKKFKGWYK